LLSSSDNVVALDIGYVDISIVDSSSGRIKKVASGSLGGPMASKIG